MAKIMDRPGQESPDVRERLLAEALRLFTSRGYAATTVREIVEAAGVTKPVLYYYFGNKEGLYLEIMNGIGRLFDERVDALRMTSGSVRERLLHLFCGMFDGASSNLGAVKLAYSIYFGPPQGAPFIDFNRFFDQTLAIVAGLVEEGMANGEIAPRIPDPLVWSLVGSYHTILEEQICRSRPRVDSAGLKAVINMILDGAAAAPAPGSATEGEAQ